MTAWLLVPGVLPPGLEILSRELILQGVGQNSWSYVDKDETHVASNELAYTDRDS